MYWIVPSHLFAMKRFRGNKTRTVTRLATRNALIKTLKFVKLTGTLSPS